MTLRGKSGSLLTEFRVTTHNDVVGERWQIQKITTERMNEARREGKKQLKKEETSIFFWGRMNFKLFLLVE